MQSIRKHQLSKLEGTLLSLMILSGVSGFLYFLSRKFIPGRKALPHPHLDIEIRYEAEKDADATMLAQSQVKVIRMVLVPLEKKIQKEKAQLIYVFGGDFWEMRLRNASPELKHSIRDLLEAREW